MAKQTGRTGAVGAGAGRGAPEGAGQDRTVQERTGRGNSHGTPVLTPVVVVARSAGHRSPAAAADTVPL